MKVTINLYNNLLVNLLRHLTFIDLNLDHIKNKKQIMCHELCIETTHALCAQHVDKPRETVHMSNGE